MKYTKYLSNQIHSNGVPTIQLEQFKTLMNIVHLEGRLVELNGLKANAQKSAEPHKFDLRIQDVTQQLFDITRNCDPRAFFILLLAGEE